jgi:hypothetical protein
MPVTVPELITALAPYADEVDGEARTLTVQTRHRRYLVTGVRAGQDGDPVIEVVFDD